MLPHSLPRRKWRRHRRPHAHGPVVGCRAPAGNAPGSRTHILPTKPTPSPPVAHPPAPTLFLLLACSLVIRGNTPLAYRMFDLSPACPCPILLPPARPMSQDEIELVYRVFDTNKDGFLELSELLRMEEHMDSFSSTHLS